MHKKCIGSMATFPAREKTLNDVVSSLSKQLDVLYIYLNEYTYIPKCLENYDNVIPVLGIDTYGDLNANGKMIYLDYEQDDCLVFTMDDDIIFPDNYVQTMSNYLESMNYKVALTVHGSIIPDTASWYYERTHIFGARKAFSTHKAVNLVGSGTFVYNYKSIPLTFVDFTKEVYVDLNLSLAALNSGIPLIAVKREADWIKFIKYVGLWEQFKVDLTHHTRIMQSNTVWRLNKLQKIWKNFLDSETEDWWNYTKEKHLDLEFCASIYSDKIPFLWRGSRVSMDKALNFSQNFIQ